MASHNNVYIFQLYACGEGTNGRLGLGHSNNVSTPRANPYLSHVLVRRVAVHSGGKHALALTADGKVSVDYAMLIFFCIIELKDRQSMKLTLSLSIFEV